MNFALEDTTVIGYYYTLATSNIHAILTLTFTGLAWAELHRCAISSVYLFMDLSAFSLSFF